MIEIRICGIILGIILVFIIGIKYKLKHDIFHPEVLFFILEFIRYVPGLLFLEKESSVQFTTDLTVKLLIFELIYILSVMIGMDIAKKIKFKSNEVNDKGGQQYNLSTFMIIVFFLIGLSAKILAIKKVGGIAFVLSNPQLAYLKQEHGFGIYTQFYKFMLLAILAMCEKTIKEGNRKKNIMITGIMVLVYVASYLIYTSRTPGLIVFIIILFIINFKIKKISLYVLFDIKIWIIILFIFSASFYATKNRMDTTNEVTNTALEDMITNLSNDGRDMFVYNYFSMDNYLLGKGYLNIIPSLIPGKKDKPSTDDGLYLVNLIRGYDVDINSNYNEYPSKTGSVPFSSQAYMYANFGVFGIVIGGIIIGLISMIAYRRVIIRNSSFDIAIYFYIIYSFGLSTGRMVPVLITIIFITIFSKFMKVKIKYGDKII